MKNEISINIAIIKDVVLEFNNKIEKLQFEYNDNNFHILKFQYQKYLCNYNL